MNTLSIAAYNSSKTSKRSADFICNGLDDSGQLADAFAALPLGGNIAFSEGTFLLTEPIVYPAVSVVLCGQGAPSLHENNHATRLRFLFSTEADCVVFHPSAIGQSLENVAIIGDGASTRHGIVLGNGCAFKHICSVGIFGVTDSGVYGHSGNSQNCFERVFTTNLIRGFLMYGNANLYISCGAIRHADVGLGGNWGFRSHETGSTYISCIAERHMTGFHAFVYATGVTFQNCYAEGCGVSLDIDGDPAPLNTRVYGFYSYAARHATIGAIRVLKSIGTLLSGLLVRGSTTGISLEIGATANTLLVMGSTLEDTQPFTVALGAVVRIEDCNHQGQWLDWTNT